MSRRRWFKRRERRHAEVVPGSYPCVDGTEATVPATDGAELWYRVQGDGPRVLVVPCCGNDADFEPLVRPDRTLVFYDVRNRGRSEHIAEPDRLGFSAEVADLASVRAALGILECTVVGWSYHAGVAAAHTLENPGLVKALVLAAPVAPRSGTSTRPGAEAEPAALAHLDQLTASGLPDKDPAAWCAAWRSVYVPLLMGDPDAFERMSAVCHLPNERPAHVVTALVSVFASLGTYDWREPLGALTVPTLVVQGAEDAEPPDSAYEWAAAVRNGKVHLLDDVGQFPWIEQSEEFAGLVDDFVEMAYER